MQGASRKVLLPFLASENLVGDEFVLELDLDDPAVEPPRPTNGDSGAVRAGRHTGLKALMLAVLEEAIVSYLCSKGRVQMEAACWIEAAGQRSPFSFPIVCETLGLDPSSVRAALQRLRDNNVSSRRAIGRSRPNARRLHRSGGRTSSDRRSRASQH